MRSPYASYRRPTRLYARWYKRHPLLTALGVVGAIVVIVLGMLALVPSSMPNNRAQVPAATQPATASPSINPSLSVPQYGSVNDDYDHKLAVEIKNDYPEYYRCGQYPADTELNRKDLKPAINVLSKLTYDKQRKEFVATNTAGVTTKSVTERYASTETTNGSYRVQTFTFVFGPGVTYYQAVRHFPAATGDNAVRWDSTQQLWFPAIHAGWQLSVNPDSDTVTEYWVMATGGTCANDIMTSALWSELYGANLECPEYAVSGMRP